MTTDHGSGPTLTTGEGDSALDDRLTEELTAFNAAATGVSDHGTFSVKVADEAGASTNATAMSRPPGSRASTETTRTCTCSSR